MSSVVVSNVPQAVTEERLKEFFSFCGMVRGIKKVSTENGFSKYIVSFELEKALSTALLLNDAQLDDAEIKVSESDQPPPYEKGDAKVVDGDHKIQENQDTGNKRSDDVEQEEKPKYAIMAQLLASGYTISDNLIQRAIDFDHDKGYSSKFRSWLNSIDQKYIHTDEPDSPANKGLSKAQVALNDLSQNFNNSSYNQRLHYYLEKAANHPYGVKIHDFYNHLAQDVKEVHNEARRLAELNKQEPNTNTEDSTSASGAK